MTDILLVTIDPAETRTGSQYVRGTFRDTEGNIQRWKMWDQPLDSFEYQVGDIISVDMTFQEKFSDFVVNSIHGVSVEANKDDFFQLDPNNQDHWDQIHELMSGVLTPAGYELFCDILNPNEERFRQEYAGTFMHDCYAGGLQWHSFKVTFHLFHAVKLSSHVLERVNKDVLFIGAMLHDMGKIWEYDFGARASYDYAGHRLMMVEYCSKIRPRIEEVLGTDGYWRLLSIFNQHHGKWEERPRTVEAMLVHLADSFEANFTHVDEGIPDLIKTGQPIRIDEFRVK